MIEVRVRRSRVSFGALLDALAGLAFAALAAGFIMMGGIGYLLFLFVFFFCLLIPISYLFKKQNSAFTRNADPSQQRVWAVFYQAIVGSVVVVLGALFIRSKHQSTPFGRLWEDAEKSRRMRLAEDEREMTPEARDKAIAQRERRKRTDIRAASWLTLVTASAAISWFVAILVF